MSWVANVVTMAGLALGTWAILALLDGASVGSVAPVILVAGMLDAVDGWLARSHGSTTEGPGLDALADLVCFGVAPAMLALQAGLHELGAVGRVVAVGFVLATAWRLARGLGGGATVPHRLQGLPCTMAGGTWAAWLWSAHALGLSPSPVAIALVAGVFSVLMVGLAHYPRLEALRSGPGGRWMLAAMLACFAVGHLRHPSLGWSLAGAIYLFTPALPAPLPAHAATLRPPAARPPAPPGRSSA